MTNLELIDEVRRLSLAVKALEKRVGRILSPFAVGDKVDLKNRVNDDDPGRVIEIIDEEFVVVRWENGGFSSSSYSVDSLEQV